MRGEEDPLGGRGCNGGTPSRVTDLKGTANNERRTQVSVTNHSEEKSSRVHHNIIKEIFERHV